MGYKFILRFAGKITFFTFYFLVFLIPILISISEAATLSVPPTHGKPGETVSIPIEIREGKGLAGLKLILVYDKDVLSYKSYKVSPLLQDKQVLVNPKESGRIIFVMAGATGIQKEEGPLITLDFEITSPPTSNKGPYSLELENVEMLDEKIKPIPFKAQNGIFQLNIK